MNYNKKINKQKIKYRENLKLIDCKDLFFKFKVNKMSKFYSQEIHEFYIQWS